MPVSFEGARNRSFQVRCGDIQGRILPTCSALPPIHKAPLSCSVCRSRVPIFTKEGATIIARGWVRRRLVQDRMYNVQNCPHHITPGPQYMNYFLTSVFKCLSSTPRIPLQPSLRCEQYDDLWSHCQLDTKPEQKPA